MKPRNVFVVFRIGASRLFRKYCFLLFRHCPSAPRAQSRATKNPICIKSLIAFANHALSEKLRPFLFRHFRVLSLFWSFLDQIQGFSPAFIPAIFAFPLFAQKQAGVFFDCPFWSAANQGRVFSGCKIFGSGFFGLRLFCFSHNPHP